MIRKLTILRLVFLLTGCGSTPPVVHVDTQLQPYLDWVEAEARARARNFPLNLYGDDLRVILVDDLGGNTIGRCNVGSGGRTISIDKSYFELASDKLRKQLVMHEVGHCVLGLGHDDEARPDGCVYSVMSAVAPYGWCVEKYWEEYLDDYFGGRP